MLKLDEYWKAVHGLIEMSISYNKKCVEEWGGVSGNNATGLSRLSTYLKMLLIVVEYML